MPDGVLDPIPRADGPQADAPQARRRSHAWVDARDRALHVAIADHVRRDPSLRRLAEATLDRLEPDAAPGAQWALRAWRRLRREQPLDALLAFLTSGDEQATALHPASDGARRDLRPLRNVVSRRWGAATDTRAQPGSR